jgi:plastocyanin domain-containing protein
MKPVHTATIAAVLALAAAACNKDAKPAAASDGAIPITANEKGFLPNEVKLQAGMPAALVFTRTTDSTCATEVVFPELNIKKDLPKDTAVRIDIPTDKAQTLTFQCGMGMYKSSVVIAAK